MAVQVALLERSLSKKFGNVTQASFTVTSHWNFENNVKI